MIGAIAVGSRAEMAWPWTDELTRIKDSAARFRLLRNDHEGLLQDFFTARWGEERLQALGQLDLGWNPLMSYAAQFSTPGLYGDPPDVLHPDDAAKPLIEEGGILEDSGFASLLHDAEYLVRGGGCVAVVPYINDGALGLRLVPPHDLHVDLDPSDPLRPLRVYELCGRILEGHDGTVLAFDVWDLTNPEEPEYRIEVPTRSDGRKVIDSSILRGDAYHWRYSDGRPFIPHTFYRDDRSAFWGAFWRNVGLHRGTFYAASLGIDAVYAADSASFGITYFVNCKPLGMELRTTENGDRVQSLAVLPGSKILMESTNEMSPSQVLQFGPSADPSMMMRVAHDYQQNLLANAGLRAPDATRQNAGGNPTSAAALLISDTDRRMAQRLLIPLFRPVDRELLGKCAALLNRQTGSVFPESGYSLSYNVLPLSPQERQQDADAARAEYADGLISRVQLYQRLHPGTDEHAALQALTEAAEQEAELEGRVGPKKTAPSLTPPPSTPPSPEDPNAA